MKIYPLQKYNKNFNLQTKRFTKAQFIFRQFNKLDILTSLKAVFNT